MKDQIHLVCFPPGLFPEVVVLFPATFVGLFIIGLSGNNPGLGIVDAEKLIGFSGNRERDAPAAVVALVGVGPAGLDENNAGSEGFLSPPKFIWKGREVEAAVLVDLGIVCAPPVEGASLIVEEEENIDEAPPVLTLLFSSVVASDFGFSFVLSSEVAPAPGNNEKLEENNPVPIPVPSPVPNAELNPVDVFVDAVETLLSGLLVMVEVEGLGMVVAEKELIGLSGNRERDAPAAVEALEDVDAAGLVMDVMSGVVAENKPIDFVLSIGVVGMIALGFGAGADGVVGVRLAEKIEFVLSVDKGDVVVAGVEKIEDEGSTGFLSPPKFI